MHLSITDLCCFIHVCACRVASLLEKRTHRSCGFKADYVGFSVPDE